MWAIGLIEQPYFDPLILLTILCNCVTMAWDSPLDPPGTWKAGLLGLCEWTYLAMCVAPGIDRAARTLGDRAPSLLLASAAAAH